MTPETADEVAARAHGADRNRAGLPFIDHVRRVASHFRGDPDPVVEPAALLHDTVEKGWMEWPDLRAAGADDRLIEIVDALTERDGEAVQDYLARCAAHPVALRIKRVDIADKLLQQDQADLDEDMRRDLRDRAHQRLALLEQLASEGD